MKRKFTLMITALMLLLTSFVWGQTRTVINWTASEQGYENGQAIDSVEFDSNVTARFYKGSNNNPPKYYNTGTALRCYGGNFFTITTTSGTLTEITMTFSSGEGTNAITTDVGDYEDGTWTGSATSVTFSIGGTTGHRRIATFAITYGSGGGVQTVATPTFSPAGGTYTQAQTVSINYTTSGATIYYTTDGTNPGVNEAGINGTVYSSPINISETTTLKAMAVKNGMNNSGIATATYTIQDAPTLITIEAAKALAENAYALVQGIVTFIDGRNVYIQDETAGIDLYLNSNSVPQALALGDKVQAYGKRATFNGLIELSGINGGEASQFSILSTGNTLPLAEKTIAEILDDAAGTNQLQSTRVQIVEATVGTINTSGNTPITQGQNTLNIYKIPVVDGLAEGNLVTVIGVIGYFNNPQLRVATAADVTIHQQQTQIVATPTFTPAAGTYSEAQTISIECATSGATIYYTLDGNDPFYDATGSNGTQYTAPISISETTTVKAIAVKAEMNNSEIATAVYTINIAPSQATTYTMITNANALVAGARYIIVGFKSDGSVKALGKQATNNRVAVDVTMDDSAITLTPAASNDSDGVFELILGRQNGNWTLFDTVNAGFLYAASSTANQLKVQGTNNANGEWTIQFGDDGVATIKAQGTNTHNWLRLNSNGSPFSCYASGQLDVYLFKAGDVPTPPAPTYFTVNIADGITHGTVTANPTSATAGTTINVTATPDNNYELATLTYSYTGTAPIDIMDSKQFVMPACDVTINATFTEQQSGYTTITIAQARALANDTYAQVQGVVTFIEGRNVYIQDSTAGIDLYLNGNTVPQALAIGDKVQAYGKRATFNGLIELSGINGGEASQFSILSSGNVLPLAEKTIAEILNDVAGNNMLQSTRVQIVEATVGTINTSGNTPITQGQNTLNIYKIPVVDGLAEGNLVTVIGVIGYFNNPQLRVATAADVTIHQQQTQIVATPTFTPAAGTYSEAQTISIECATSGATIYYTLDGNDPFFDATGSNGTQYTTPISISETTTVKAIAVKAEMNNSEIATAVYTIQTTPPTPSQETTYTMITNANALVAGDRYIIVGVKADGSVKALGKQATNNRVAVDVTVVDSTITVTPAAINDSDGVFELILGQQNGNWTLFDTVNAGFLYAASSSANQLKVQETNDANGEWNIQIAADGVATIKAQGTNTRNWLRLNSNGSPFSCYASGQLDVYLYKAGDVPTPPAPTYFTVNIADGITHGTVTANPTSATAGTTINVTATPDNNYELATLTYSYTGTAPIDIKETKQFVMPACDVTINATFTEQQGGPTTITIAEAKALNLNEYAQVQGVVTFIDGRNVYIQDSTAGIDLFLNGNTVPQALALGDLVQAYGKRAAYNGLIELSGIDGGEASQFSILSSGNELPLAEKTIAEILDDAAGNNMLQSTRVQIVEAVIGTINTSGNTPITQGESTLNIYKMPVVDGLEEGDIVTVIGVIGCFNNPQLRVATAADVAFEHANTPRLVATPNTLSGFTYNEGEGPSSIKTFVLTGSNLTGTAYVYPAENFQISTFNGDNFVPEPRISINTISGNFSYNIYVRMKEGLAVGSYSDNLALCSPDTDTAYVAVNGTVLPQAQSSDYVRISELSQLGNGSKVIFAARFDGNVNDYYAMTAVASGKPTGVLFSSVAGNNGETLPSTIADEENTYYWTVTTDGTNFTFTNADGDVLGYTSSTNFATGGDNTAWSVEYATSEATAMVPEYSAFVVTNVNVSNRAFALNSNHNFGPYHVQNMASESYNFFIDMFATTGSGTMICATPTFTPAGGTYFESQEVTISCTTADATIYYTTDGSDPTEDSDVYAEPIVVAENTIIKAIAVKEGYDNSAIATAEYTIIVGAVTIFNQDWEGEMNGWTFVNVEGNKPWSVALHSGNHYAYANGYNDDSDNEQWCISPAFNLDNYSNVSLTFMNAKNYNGPDLQLFFSNDYDGEDPTNATWTELTFEMSTGSYAWAESGVIDMNDFSGSECYIGFRYISTLDEGAAAWEVDDITLIGFTTDPYLNVTPTALTGFTHYVGEGPSASQFFTLTAGNMVPAPGGTTGSINITVVGSEFEISLDDETYTWQLFIDDVTNLDPTPVYVRMNGAEVGEYTATVEISASSGDDAVVSLSGEVIEQPQGGGDWTRILSLADLNDGDQVIIASRYDATVGNGYYAMPAVVSGKPDGVLFTSINENGSEMLPDEITAEEETYLWNVTISDGVITLVNSDGDALGYTSSTNFAGNENTEWNIAYETSGENAMLPNYSGFVITNAMTTNRGIAKNASNKFGAYSTSNINNADYNFYLDLFVQGGTATPTVAAPVFSVASGTYYEAFDVEITCATEGATIYYTTDGSEPTAASEVYTSAIYVDQDMTIKAIAMMEGYDDSPVTTANYVVITGVQVIFSQDWEGDMNGWTFVTVEGNKPWTIGTYAGNKYANANGYNDDVDNEQWCISPAFNLDQYNRRGIEVTLNFLNATKFNGPALELYFCDDYDGEDPTTASWQPLDYIQSEGNYVWTESGPISLNNFSGSECYIGFRYISTLDEGAAAWEIDDIVLSAQSITNVDELTWNVDIWNRDHEILIENGGNTMQMMVYNVLGQPVMSGTVNAGSNSFYHNLSNGLYIVTLQNNEGKMSAKIVVR